MVDVSGRNERRSRAMAWFKQDGRAQMDTSKSSDVRQIVGRIIEGGEVKKCSHCGGTRGWNVAGGVVNHLACGAVQ
jgi:hypothetical protein